MSETLEAPEIQVPKYQIGDIVTLARMNNEPDNDKYNIFYFDGDLNFSWEGTGNDHRFIVDPTIIPGTWGKVDAQGIMQDEINICEDIGTNFLIVDTKFPALEIRMGFYVLVSLTTNVKYKEDYFKIDALMDKVR